jgi:hypothetical protein
MPTEEITSEQVRFAEGVHKKLTDPTESLTIGYSSDRLEALNTNLGVPEHLSPEEFKSIEQLGQRQMLFTRAIANFSRLVENRDDVPFWLKRLVNFGLEEGDIHGSSQEAVKLLKQLNEKAMKAEAYSMFGRLDMVEGKDSIRNEDGVEKKIDVVKVAEVQTAMGGMGTAGAIQEAMYGEGAGNSVIESFKAIFAEETSGEGNWLFMLAKAWKATPANS